MEFILIGKANFSTKSVNFILDFFGFDYGFNFFCAKKTKDICYFTYEFGKLNKKRTDELYKKLVDK